MDFDFTTETITPDNTNILTIGGTGGLELPVGNTAARPGSPQNGIIRYNSTTGTAECFISNAWASSMAPIMNQAIVQKNPGAGEFGSISAACASITNATAENLWEVLVAPGTYTEPEIIIPPYVNVSGLAEYDIMVQPDSNSHHVFVMSANTSLNFLQVTGAGTGFAAVAILDAGDYTICHKVAVTDSDTGFLIGTTNTDSVTYLEYCDVTGGGTGISITSSNGFSQNVNLENFYIYGDAVDQPITGMYAAGPDVVIDIQAFGFEGATGTNTGIIVEDGATISAKAGHLYGWNIGAHITDNGAATLTKFLGCAFRDNTTWDLYSQHIGASGLLAGQARKDFVNAMASPDFVSAFADPEINAFVQTGSFYMGATQANLTDVTDLIIETPPVGLMSGGVLSVSSGRTASVSAGHGYLRKAGYMTRVEWSASTILLPASSLPYVYIDDNGTVQYSASMPATTTTILLGRAAVNATDIYGLGALSTNIENYGNQVEQWLRLTVGPVFVSGSVVSENLSTPRAINVTAGHWYYGTQHRMPSASTAPTITDTYKSAGVLTFSAITQIPNDTYDNGTNLVSLTTGYFTKHVLYQSGEGAFQSYTLVHGQAEYATENDALNAPLPSPYINSGATPKIASFIVQQGVNSLVQIIDERPIFFGKVGTGSSGTNIHGDLLGLDGDDHPQYLLVDGTRAMTGDFNMGSNDITSAGTINSVTIEAHASRHQPNGADPIPTGSAVGVSTSTVNGPGISNSLSRADHTHALFGVQPLDATLTALAAYNTNGILTQTAADTFTGRTITGTTNRITLTNGDGVAGNPTVDISASYAGQSTITTLGTVTTGVWNGTTIAAVNGGTGQTVYAVGDILYANTTTTLAKLADIATGNALISGGVNTAPSWGKIGLTTHVSGILPIASGGTNLSSLGTANQILGVNTGATGLEYKTVTAGTGITITPGAGTVTIAATNSGAVTSVGLSLPSIFSVSGSPVTSTGTLTGALATQAANTFFIGPASGGAAAPTFRTVGIDELSDVVITTPANNQVITYNGANWVNAGTVGANASGLVGVGQAGAAAWTLLSGSRYYADFAHNLGTTNYTVTVWDTADNSVVIPQTIVSTNTNTVRITVTGNTTTLKVVVVANGQSIVAGGSTPSSVIAAKDGVTITAASTKLNFVGQNVGVTDVGAGTTNIVIGQRFTFFAAALDTPVNSDFAVNALAAMVADPTYPSLNVRQFSNTTEQGVAFLVSIPTGATTMVVKTRGRAQTAPGVASVVQPRMYFRLLPNNSAVAAWSAAQELANIAIPTNANFQYSTQTISLATFGLTAGNLYQVEMTRRTAGVTGTNLAANYLLAELTVEFA